MESRTRHAFNSLIRSSKISMNDWVIDSEFLASLMRDNSNSFSSAIAVCSASSSVEKSLWRIKSFIDFPPLFFFYQSTFGIRPKSCHF